MQTSATPDDQPLHADAAAEAQPDSSWTLDKLGAFASGEVSIAFFAKEAAILQATKSAVHLHRAGHALSLAREKCKGEGHGDWANFKRKHGFASTTVNDAIRLYAKAETEDAVVGLGITEAKKKFVYPPKKAVTNPASPVKKPGKKAAKSAAAPLDTGVAQEQPNIHAQTGEPTTNPGQTATDDDDAAPDEPEVSFTTALIEELEEIAQRLAEIAQDDFGKATWTAVEASQGHNAVNSIYPTLKTIQRRLRNEEYR
jgi:hypothetical protein